ncbi:MAG: hypothetical protein AB7K71_19025 [Polyangiaceae bacterium]
MSNAVVRSLVASTLAVAAACLMIGQSTPAQAAPTSTATVSLRNIDEQLVPFELVHGDREFGGNGPRIKCSTTLSVTGDKRRILATVDFNARETKSDWSETRGSWTKTVYYAPKGKQIESIVSGSYSKVDFVSKPAGFQLFGPTEDFVKFLGRFNEISQAMFFFANPAAKADTAAKREMKRLNDLVMKGLAYLPSEGNHVHIVAPSSGPVQAFAIVGDTGGPDISTDTNGKDDTRINGVKFKKIQVRLSSTK